jgi:hypothetical protein
VAQRQPHALALDAHGDQPDASPRVEPAVQEVKLGRAWWQLEEAECGVEGGETTIAHS